MHHKSLVLIAAIGVVGLSTSAGAADLPAKVPAVMPTYVSAYNWSGFYIGGNFGYGNTDADWTNKESSPAATFFDAVPGDTFSHGMSGIMGGGQIGYNYQAGQWVFGIEAMLDAAAIKGSYDYTSAFAAADDQFEARIDSLLTVTARLGYAWDNVLFYGKAGIATARIKASVTDDVPAFTGAGNDSQWRTGPTVGVGIEYGITRNLSLAVEYDYTHLGSGSYQLGGGAGSYVWDVDVRNISQVTGKLNYRFY
jgi:outer membrane immunogenic protein